MDQRRLVDEALVSARESSREAGGRLARGTEQSNRMLTFIHIDRWQEWLIVIGWGALMFGSWFINKVSRL